MTKKYICKGGFVTSNYDGQRHYIHSSRLPHLYRVDRNECYFFDTNDSPHKLLGLEESTLIFLQPDPTGKYQLPCKPEEQPDIPKIVYKPGSRID